MAKTLYDLARSLEKKVKAIDEAASQLAVDTAMAIVTDLAFKTPVDTSQALSNWIVTLDNPSNETIKPYYPGYFGSTQRASAAETINSAKTDMAAKKPRQKIYITNNLDYIKDLNDGSSAQEPAGFVERAIVIGRLSKKKFKIKD